MKRIRVNLAALTRVEYSKVISVPDDFSEDELTRLVDSVYDTTDGSEFWDDNEFWEKGSCNWDVVNGDEECELHDSPLTREVVLYADSEDGKQRVRLGNVESNTMNWQELERKALDEYWEERLQAASMKPIFERMQA